MSNSAFLSVQNVCASYDSKLTVVDDVSFKLEEGELACLLGPSGCGKTTVLRTICGFQDLNGGAISLANETISSSKNFVAPEKRGIGMVFQDHALFPHLTISENVRFGLHSLDKSGALERTLNYLDLVDMADHQEKYPHELSGGQSQRVALARALAPQPSLLLMDEPFSNLDTELRESLGYEVRFLLKKLGMTAIMVTHDQHDAFALGDKIGVMNEGKLQQWGSPYNLYHEPNSKFIANFIGDGVFVKGQLTSNNCVLTSFGEVQGQTINIQNTGQEIDLLVRPDDIQYDSTSRLQGKVIRKAFKGAQTLYTLEVINDDLEHVNNSNSADRLMSLVPSHNDFEIGDVIGIKIDADHLVCFERD